MVPEKAFILVDGSQATNEKRGDEMFTVPTNAGFHCYVLYIYRTRYIYIHVIYVYTQIYGGRRQKLKMDFRQRLIFWVGKDQFKVLYGLETGWHSQI